MTNPIKGELTLVVGEESYTLKLGTNELVMAEGLVGDKCGDFIPRLGDGDLRLERTVLWCALRVHHPALEMDDAGEIINELGPIKVADELKRLVSITFPPPPKAKGKGATADAARPTRTAKAAATA